MRNTFVSRKRQFGRKRPSYGAPSESFGQNRGRSSGRRQSYNWSQADLIKTVEYSKTAQVQEKVVLEPVVHETFNDFDIVEILKSNITKKGYKAPSPIQDKAIPHIIDGKDIIGIANTGTGKTAAFLIPLINKVFKDKAQKVLIVAPTRELAEQINTEFRIFSQGMNIYSALIIGGKSMRVQESELRKGVSFVIGTPGRIKDLIQRRAIYLSSFNNVVLDETDRMVDIGFITEIKYFISLLPATRQSLFFSATISPAVNDIIRLFVKNPITVSVKSSDNRTNIHQDIVRIGRSQKKIDQLHFLLTQEAFEKVLVFGNTKWNVQKIADELSFRGLSVAAIHGNKNQSQRHTILEKFKRDQVKILLATDVAARGLDIDNVSHVINYDLPETYENYIHRIGRTGRASKKGIALTFIDEN